MDPFTASMLSMGVQYGMNQMFKPKGYDVGQLKNTLAPQLQAGQFQQNYGKDMMNVNGAYQRNMGNAVGLQNRNNMLAGALMNQRSAGQYGNSAMSNKLNQSMYQDANQNTASMMATMMPQLQQQGASMYQQGTDNVGSYLQNISQAQLSNTDINTAWNQKQLNMLSPYAIQGINSFVPGG